MLPHTDTAYQRVCRKRGVKPQSETLDDGTQAHWIGDKKAGKVIINFHGGGYVLPAGVEFVEFMFQLVDNLKEQGTSAAVLFLAYDLAPGAPYPRQLQQASALLSHVLYNLQISPKNIVLTGDSAGANLVLSLLSHISHPWDENHPSSSSSVSLNGGIPKLELTENLRGAVLVAPWVSFSLADDSFKRNAYKDCINPKAGVQWSEAFMNSPHPHLSNSDYYNQPITAPSSWWKDLKVDEVLVLAGEDEVLVDGITVFTKKLKDGLGDDRVEYLIAKDEYHDQPSIDLGMGYKEFGIQAKKMNGWIHSKL